jgi:hypothetical protein
MPLIRPRSRQKLASQEGKILLALSNLQEGRINSIRAVAKLYDIPRTTLQDRASGLASRVNRRLSSHKLT